LEDVSLAGYRVNGQGRSPAGWHAGWSAGATRARPGPWPRRPRPVPSAWSVTMC